MASSRGESNHFGFLLDGDRTKDERPIVLVVPRGDLESTEVVAPNLRAFLGLVAVADRECVSRGATDAEWAAFRRESYGDDAARLAEMDRLSTLLCTIPGVVRPTSPSSVALAHTTYTFERDEDAASTNRERHELDRSVRVARDRVLALADGMVDGRVLEACRREARRNIISDRRSARLCGVR